MKLDSFRQMQTTVENAILICSRLRLSTMF
jgi:hypothetical protein